MLYNLNRPYQLPPISPFSLTANSSNINANFGDSLVLTANASSTTGPSPTGNIVVTNASTGTTIGTITVGGTSNLTTSLLPPGINTLSFSYSGDANYPATTTNITQTVLTSIYVLNASTSTLLDGSKFNLTNNCVVNIPGRIVVNGPRSPSMTLTSNNTVTARYVLGRTTATASISNSTCTPAPAFVSSSAVGDPYGTLPVPSVTGNVTSVNVTGGATVTINPGIYSQIRVSGANSTLILNPGVYILRGGGLSVTTGGRITGAGVLIYNANSNWPSTGGTVSGITLNTTASVTLSAANTGNYANVLIFQERTNPSSIAITLNSSSLLTGIVYTRGSLVSVSGSVVLRLGIVADQINASNGSQFRGDSSGLF